MKKPREICAAIGALVRTPALCIATFTALACVGFIGWPVELFAHFRFQYAVLLAMSIPYLLYLERNRVNKIYLATCVAALIANIVVVTLDSTSFNSNTTRSVSKKSSEQSSGKSSGQTLGQDSQVNPRVQTTFSLLQFNVNSHSTNYPAFDKLIAKRKPDIVCIEEVSGGWSLHFEKLKNIYPYQSVRARTDNFGIGILSKYKIEQTIIESFGGAGVPTIFVDLAVPTDHGDSKQIQVIATHPLPPVTANYTTMRDLQMHELAKRITQSEKLTILAGDFNCTPWTYIFKDFMKESGLVDSRLNKGIEPTWPTMLPYLMIPIDHIFISPSIKCTARQVEEDCGSDHHPVFAKFVF